MLSTADYSDCYSDSDEPEDVESEDTLDRLTKVCFFIIQFFLYFS